MTPERQADWSASGIADSPGDWPRGDASADDRDAPSPATSRSSDGASGLLEVRGLVRRYGSGDAALTVLKGVDLTIERGEYVAIIGSSGSGKSTLMNILGALDRPDGGYYRFAGRDLARMSSDERAQLRRAHFGFIFQSYHLIPGLDARENIEIPALYDGVSAAHRHQRSGELLRRLGLADRSHHVPSELSGGQQQRVSIARALVNDPDVLFADEPTGALDTTSGAEVLRILRELHAEGRTIVMVTHDPDIAAAADRVIEIRDGEILRDQRRTPIDHTVARASLPAASADIGPSADREPDSAPVMRPRAPIVHGEAVRGGGSGNWTLVLLASLAMAARSLWRNRLRTFLTMIGILIGVASVVALMGIGQGARAQVIEQITARGSDLLDVRSGSRTVRGRGGERARFNDETLAMIEQEPYVLATSPEPGSTQTVRHERSDVVVQVVGTSEDWPLVRDASPQLGVFFDVDQVERFAMVAVLGSTTRDNLFGPNADPVGETILIGSTPFRVVGVMPASGATSFGFRDQDDQVIVPWTTAGSRLFGNMTFDHVVVKVRPGTDLFDAEQSLTAALANRYQDDSYHVRNQADAIALRSATQETFTQLLLVIAAISLVVGGIGVMNIMLVSVTERVHEIGVRMAVGARERDIQTQFLAEAVAVCVVGGLLGIAVGLGAGALLESSGDWRMVYAWEPVVLAFACAVATGLVFGLWPARKAARLDPVRALSGG